MAEDDADLRQLIASVLRADGHQVVEASSGTQLVDVVLKHAIYAEASAKLADVIISDIRMPGCSGLQVLADIHGRTWAPPVVLMTAFCDSLTHQEAKRLGASALMEKPLDLNNLRSIVDELVSD